MSRRSPEIGRSFAPSEDAFDLDTLLHPANAFEHPQDVVRDPDLTLNEKRAILASWASDACAVDVALRRPPGGGRAVEFDDIIDALRSLDRQEGQPRPPEPHYRHVLRRGAARMSGPRGRRPSEGRGNPLN